MDRAALIPGLRTQLTMHGDAAWDRFWEKATDIAGFRPENLGDLSEIQKWLNSKPLPPGLLRLTRDGGSKKDWFDRVKWGFFRDVLDGLAAAHYHLANIERMERGIYSLAITALPSELPPRNSATKGGNSKALDYEYQAFLFALRRTLEYTARSIAAFFKSEVRSFRKLADTVLEAHPPEPIDNRELVADAARKAMGSLSDVLGSDEDGAWATTRDLIAHKESIGAGIFNVIRGPQGGIAVSLAGGGEDIARTNPELLKSVFFVSDGDVVMINRLSPRMRERLLRVESSVSTLFKSLMPSVHPLPHP